MIELQGACQCGHVKFDVLGQPKFRMLCHCTICQAFNQAAHADVLVFKTAQIETPPSNQVSFKTMKRPPNVSRGVCIQCGQPAIEVFAMPLFPKLTMVPAGMFANTDGLPAPVAHMFYESRVADADDGIPKYQGFLRSQMAFFKHLWRS